MCVSCVCVGATWRWLYARGGVCVRGDVRVRQVRVAVGAVMRVALVRMAHPHAHHRAWRHGGHGRGRGDWVRSRGDGQGARGQGGHKGHVVGRAAQCERVVGRAGEAHGVQRAVDVLRVQAVQSVQGVQGVMVEGVVPLIR